MVSSENSVVEVPESIPILPMRNAVIFPGSIVPVDIGRKKSLSLIESVKQSENSIIGIITQRDPSTEDPREKDLFEIGTIARILKMVNVTSDSMRVIIQGVSRFQLIDIIKSEPFLIGNIISLEDEIQPVIMEPEIDSKTGDIISAEKLEDESEISDLDPNTIPNVELDALLFDVKDVAKKVIKLMPDIPNEAVALLDSVQDPGQLADLISANVELSIEKKQKLLEDTNIIKRLMSILVLLKHQMAVYKVREKISSQVQHEMGKSQREYVLRQHLKAIKDELGENDDGAVDVDEFAKLIENKPLTEEAKVMALKQLGRLKLMSIASSEYSVTHTYLDWLLNLPWGEKTEDTLDISKVRDILDSDHYDMDKVKKRIIEYLAVRKLNPQKKGPILCLIGPPGVGKTSLGKSIARAMGRKFWRISLGGVRDEAEIRGHRRTYVGALPGRIIQGIKKTGVSNPVFMMDEIDKLGNDFRGDPSSALLEVLDPEQNSTFSDHYLEVQFDLSSVMFIATANRLDTIPSPLLDRMEILELPGYTRNEKYEIAKKYIIPRQVKDNGLSEGEVSFTREGVLKIIGSYTREAGVRSLERNIEACCRGVAVKKAENKLSKVEVLDEENLKPYLGTESYLDKSPIEPHEPGVATGLAWTPVGGTIIYIESRIMKGKGGLLLTGQLGDVMKESVQAALSLIKSNSSTYNISDDIFSSNDIHIHVPSGAVPKDGPSAGITMFISLLSLFSQKKVRHDVAMTGEITLRGRVLPVGGIKEKALAAHRAGIKTLILPEQNTKDLEDIPEEAKNDMNIIFVSRIEEIPPLALID